MTADETKIKKNLRKLLKEKRNFLKQENKNADEIIFSRLINHPAFKDAKNIFCYISYGSEISTLKLAEHILSCGKTLTVPRCIDENGNMTAVEVSSLDSLKPGTFNILEPTETAAFDKNEINLAIVPGLAFDENGYRLGYGKGYYDRFLSDLNVKKIGICHKELLLKNVPHNRFDVRMDEIITG